MFSVTYWAIIDLAFQSEATSPLLRHYSRNRKRNMVELTLLLSRYFYGSVVAGIKRANPPSWEDGLPSIILRVGFFSSRLRYCPIAPMP